MQACFRLKPIETGWIRQHTIVANNLDQALNLLAAAPLAKYTYGAFCDPAGGSGGDSFTMAIAHKDGERVVIDAIRETRPPFNPEAAIDDYSNLLKSYRITKITGDRYAGEFSREQFRKRNINYEYAERPKSDLYRDFLPMLNSGRVVLPKSDRLVSQLCNLERRVSRAGKDSIDHAPNAHDDVANCCAGVVSAVTASKYDYDSSLDWVSGPSKPKEEELSYQQMRFARFIASHGRLYS